MLTLVLGGARSGKSDLAMRLAAAAAGDVLFVATMQPLDAELRARVGAHRAARPAHWHTVEEPIDVLDALEANARARDAVIIDCLTLWISNMLIRDLGDAAEASATQVGRAVAAAVERAEAVARWAVAFDRELIAVSNEVGLGVVPPYPLGRAFRDALGGANRAFVAGAQRVLYTTAGLAIDLKALGAMPVEAFGQEPA